MRAPRETSGHSMEARGARATIKRLVNIPHGPHLRRALLGTPPADAGAAFADGAHHLAARGALSDERARGLAPPFAAAERGTGRLRATGAARALPAQP